MSGAFPSVVALLLIASCGTSPAAPRMASLAEPFTLAPGRTAQVEGTGLSVTFHRVSADSRCPVDVTCVWEGDAVVVVSAGPDAASSRELHTSVRYASEMDVGEYRVRLVSLAPVPRASGSPAPGDYRATLVVTRK